MWLPDHDTLDLVAQVTQHDCDAACREEARRRSDAFKCKVQIGGTDDYSRVPYKIIRAKESAPPTDLPVDKKVRAALLRSRKGQNALKLNEFVHIPQYAKLFMNDVELEFLAQDECKVFFKQKGDAAGRCAYHLVCRRHPW